MHSEELGFSYIGPLDGHNLQEMEVALRDAKNMKGPIFIHVKSKKEKGIDTEMILKNFMEFPPFNINTRKVCGARRNYSKAFWK